MNNYELALHTVGVIILLIVLIATSIGGNSKFVAIIANCELVVIATA